MKPTRITLLTEARIAPVDSRIFGGFLEHMGRAVYEGVYQPDSPHADAEGCRRDVLDALRRLDMTAMRYPGGNFASGYHWQDGVGPRESRPTLRELAWQSLEPNRFGTDEFIGLCRKMGWTPMLTVNLGTGTPEEARNWLEYCNGKPGTRYADLRVANGHREPYAVKLWCLGNEMDGDWQLGHVPAGEYAIRAQQAAKLMKDLDKSIELVACGTSGGMGMRTYMEWDRQVLEYFGTLHMPAYISLHRYVSNHDNDTPNFLAITKAIDRQIEEMDAACRYVKARHRSDKRTYLCFDEWNVWSSNEYKAEREFPRHLAEVTYTLEDALVVAGFLHSFVRHADVMKIANLAQIVNVIAPVMTRGDRMFIQTIFHPFEMFSRRRRGEALRVFLDGPSYEAREHGTCPFIDASAILDGKALKVFLTNRSVSEPAEVRVALADGAIRSRDSAEILTGPGAKAANSFEDDAVVKTAPFDGVKIMDGQALCALPPLSFAALTLTLR